MEAWSTLPGNIPIWLLQFKNCKNGGMVKYKQYLELSMFALRTPWTIYFIFKKIIFISIYIRLTHLKRNTYTVIHKGLVYYNKTWKNKWLHFIKASVVQNLWCGWCLVFKWAFSYKCSKLIKLNIWLPPESHFQLVKHYLWLFPWNPVFTKVFTACLLGW